MPPGAGKKISQRIAKHFAGGDHAPHFVRVTKFYWRGTLAEKMGWP
jgi:hypothetical protein